MVSSLSPIQRVLRTALIFGLGVGAFSLLWLVFLLLVGNNPYGPKRLMSTVILPFVVIGGQWFLRRYFQPTGPGLGRSLLMGIVTVLVAATTAAGSLYGFARVASPHLLEQNGNEMRRILQAGRSSFVKQRDGLKHFQEQERALQRNPQPADLTQDEFSKKLLLGLLLVLPGAIFFRK